MPDPTDDLPPYELAFPGRPRFWASEELREFLKDPEFVVEDDTLVVAERFRVVR